MKRALELIKQLERAMWISYGHGFSKEESYVQDSPQYKELVRLLTPPTADEVCKVLSEELHEVVTYHNGRFIGKENVICYLWKFPNGDTNLVIDYEILPPHLITLIGRFYEGLEKVCDDE